MLNKSFSLLAISFLAFIAGFAAAKADTPASPYKIYSGNLMTYPYVETLPPAQTPAPEGYTPHHMEHYGRHGSRWLIGKDDYNIPVEAFERAERAGKLTPLGQRTLDVMRGIQKASENRLGELSDKGAVQHQIIGERMATNYPEIFAPGANVDTRSTVVIRCILSMLNSIQGIKSVQPDINLHSDASQADMYYMNFSDKPARQIRNEADSIYNPYSLRYSIDGDYLTRLVTDRQFAEDSVAPGIMPYMYRVLANTQSHSEQPFMLEEIFTVDEMEELWRSSNNYWVIHSVKSPMTRNRMPYTQRNLLRNIIESADTALLSATPSANLRYGHDGILSNLVALMDINGLGQEFATVEEAEQAGFRTYDVIPMAANMQMIFYRPADPRMDWLVKVLYNEKEVTLPVPSVTGPYYSWPVLRRYYLDMLDTFDRDWQ